MQSYKWEMYVVIQEINLQNTRQKVVYIMNTNFDYRNKIQNQDPLLR